jgi:hypothetical protein
MAPGEMGLRGGCLLGWYLIDYVSASVSVWRSVLDASCGGDTHNSLVSKRHVLSLKFP